MKKLLIFTIVCLQVAVVTGCAQLLPDAHRIDVQQGNVIDQEALNQIRPGMNRRQVRYILGGPMVTDTFHKDRWDYIYSLQKRGQVLEQKQVTLYFANDTLVNIKGDLRPQPQTADTQFNKETVVVVNPKPRARGWFMRILDKIGLADDDYVDPAE